jgi:dTDP-4-amino-4,6-dideoxygalactose transaminase
MKTKYKKYYSLDSSDSKIAYDQVETKLMSGFVGSQGEEFYGGDAIKELERKSSQVFGYDHVISVNSWTSGLLLMVMSLELDDPSSEIIVTPWTMSATVMAIVQAGFMPVFADIDEKSFMPTLESIESKITSKTKAIFLADIFGQSFPYEQLSHLRERGIKILSDAAQAHLATRFDRPVGWQADVTGISLNRHKHINTGEGGLIFTNDSRIAEYTRRARNHGENLPFEDGFFKNMIGFNFRLTETQAAIGVNQLSKLPSIIESRQKLAAIADRFFEGSRYFNSVKPLDGNSHSYYIYPVLIKEKYRSTRFLDALSQSITNLGLPPIGKGYQNIHKIDFFSNPESTSGYYSRYFINPSCPVAEALHSRGFIGLLFCNHDFNDDSLNFYLESIETAASKIV